MVSLIICTHNRATHLAGTLEALRTLRLPADRKVELLLVDNASTDDTPSLIAGYRLDGVEVVPVHEPRKGQVRARNTALARARGDVVVFTDDDVRPSPDWLLTLCNPLWAGREAAVAGRVRLASHLVRPWMKPLHYIALAGTEGREVDEPSSLVGANFAFQRALLERVPGFDEELGPGALGFRDDTLFSYQLRETGVKLRGVWEAAVEHHFEPSRLARTSLLKGAAARGRSHAYVFHHWDHDSVASPRKQLWLAWARVAYWRARRPAECRVSEGCAEWELSLVRKEAFFRHYLKERRRPRNYEKRGLVKLQEPERVAA